MTLENLLFIGVLSTDKNIQTQKKKNLEKFEESKDAKISVLKTRC